MTLRIALAGILLATTAGCGSGPDYGPPASPPTQPTALCSRAVRDDCRSAREVEQRLEHADLTILGATGTPGGSQGARVLTLRDLDNSVTFRAKWRADSSGGVINDPRKELGAYHVQKLFLDPIDYVVPPVSARCFPLAQYRSIVDEHAKPTTNTGCVFGYLSYWIEDTLSAKDARSEGLLTEGYGLLDPQRWIDDDAYRTSLGNLNLLAFLVDHGDAHAGQFVLVHRKPHLVAYSVDHSIAFRSIENPMLLFRQDWSNLLVPTVPKPSIERLRELGARDGSDLRVLSEYELRNGMLVPVARGAPFGTGAVRRDGKRMQVGLTGGEIDGVRSRAADLIERVEKGDVDAI